MRLGIQLHIAAKIRSEKDFCIIKAIFVVRLTSRAPMNGIHKRAQEFILNELVYVL